MRQQEYKTLRLSLKESTVEHRRYIPQRQSVTGGHSGHRPSETARKVHSHYFTGKSHHCPAAQAEPLMVSVRWLLSVCVEDKAGGPSAGLEGLTKG